MARIQTKTFNQDVKILGLNGIILGLAFLSCLLIVFKIETGPEMATVKQTIIQDSPIIEKKPTYHLYSLAILSIVSAVGTVYLSYYLYQLSRLLSYLTCGFGLTVLLANIILFNSLLSSS